jgi:hypothetical protein
MGQYTQSIVTIVGTVVGTYFGYPALGTIAGSLVGGALQPNSKAAGPRIDDLKAPAFAYGSAIPRIRGRYRTAGCYIWASEKREIATTTEQGGKGGPGVDVTEFTYEIDVLIMLTDDMLAAVPRVFSNGELVYNELAGSSAATIIGTARNSLWRDMRVYTGAADQLPDPVYEQAVGVGNAPAYRGRGTVFLEGLQLGQTGQVPLLTFEVLTSSQEVFSAPEYGPQQAVVSYFPIGTPAIDTGVLRVHVGQWDNNYASSLVYVYDIDVMQGTSEVVGSYVTGTDSAWGVGQGNTDVDCLVLSKNSDLLRLYRTETGLLSEYFAPDDLGGSQVRYSIRDNDFIVGSISVGTKSLHRFSVVGGLGYAHVSSSPLPEYVEDILIHAGQVYAVDKTNGHSVYVLDLTTLALLDTIPTPLQGSGYTSQYVRLLEFRGEVAIWLPTASPPNGEHSIHRLVDDVWEHVGDMPDATGFLPGVAGGGAIGFIGNLLISGQAPTGGGNVYVTQTATLLQEPGTLDLADEVIALAAQCGIAPGDVDASDLVGIEVDGYAITQVSPVRTALEVLATAYYFECVESDRLAFRLRGGAPVATLAFERLGAAADEASEDDPLDITRGNDSEVPARVSLAYVNFDNDYQSGSVDSDRLIGVSDETRAIQLPVVMQPAKAKGIANTAVMDGRVAATTFRPAIAVATAPELEPTDVVLLTDEEGTRFRARIVRETLSGPVRQFECVLDDASVLQDVGITYEGTTPSMDVLPPADTDLLLLDIPILRDEDDYPGLYAAGKSRGGRWPGYSVHRSDDDVNYENVGAATRQAVTGFCATTLGDWTGGNVFDEQNSVTVTVGSGELSSYSRDDILDGVAPGYVVGAELLYARTATLNAPGNYTLTGLLRGRRGTEWASVGHAASERFAVLANNGLIKTALDAVALNTDLYWRGVTTGRPLSAAHTIEQQDTGVAIKPFAPVDGRSSKAVDGSLTLTWKRRTRLAVTTVGSLGITTPLGEASEEYAVDIYSDDTFATIVRTITATQETATYTAGQMVTDFGSVQQTVYARISQMSAMLGRGYPLEGEFGTEQVLPQREQLITLSGSFQSDVPITVLYGGGPLPGTYTTIPANVNLSGLATALAAHIDGDDGLDAVAVGTTIEITEAIGSASSLTVTVGGSSSLGFNLVETAEAAASPGSPYRANLIVSNPITGMTEPVPTGTTFSVSVYRPFTTLLGSFNYTTTASESKASVFSGLVAAMAATSLPALGYSLSVSTSLGYATGLFVGPVGATLVQLIASGSGDFNLGVSISSNGSAPVPAPRPQKVDASIAGTVSDGEEFVITLAGVEFSASAIGSPSMTAAQIASDLGAAIDASANYTATVDDTTITITGVTNGLAFTYSGEVRRAIRAAVTVL